MGPCQGVEPQRGVSTFPLALDLVVIFALAAVLAGVGTHFFSTMEAD
ncbi:hypothetical protein [Methanoculleus sp.]|nr:hypothetical protein [Methanoculleus sp.]MDI6866401.1 hypothetical protein [Methanoculleus sp.]